MHAGAIERQSAFAAQGVIDGPQQDGARRDQRGNELGEVHGQDVDVPGGEAEEAMKAAPVSVVKVAAGEDDIGDVAMPMGEDPPRGNLDEGPKGRLGENGRELL